MIHASVRVEAHVCRVRVFVAVLVAHCGHRYRCEIPLADSLRTCLALRPIEWRRRYWHTVSTDVIENIDISTTLAALAGLELPMSDGQNITAQLEGQAGDPEHLGVTEMPLSRSIRKGDWRFVYYTKAKFAEEYPDGFCELYNVREDPYELNNLWQEPDQQERIATL